MQQSLYLLLSLLSLSLAAILRIQVPPSNLLPNPHTLPSSSHATLISSTSPKLDALIRRGSVFEFHNLTQPGSYLLDIYTRDYTFAPYRVDITRPAPEGPLTISGIWETYRGARWDDRGPLLGGSSTDPSSNPPTQPQVITVNAKVLWKKNFYEERQGFNPLQLLKSPMILMGAAAVGITVIMPKIMESMDPEMKAEYEEMQKKGPVSGLTKAMQAQGQAGGGGLAGFDLAGWMAGAQKGTSGSGGTQNSGREVGNGDGRRG